MFDVEVLHLKSLIRLRLFMCTGSKGGGHPPLPNKANMPARKPTPKSAGELEGMRDSMAFFLQVLSYSGLSFPSQAHAPSVAKPRDSHCLLGPKLSWPQLHQRRQTCMSLKGCTSYLTRNKPHPCLRCRKPKDQSLFALLTGRCV